MTRYRLVLTVSDPGSGEPEPAAEQTVEGNGVRGMRERATSVGALVAPEVTRRLVAEFCARPGTGAPSRSLIDHLTGREVEVLRLVARGLSNTEIAEVLVVSPLTAKTHVSRMLAKLGVRDRAQLVVAAYEAGLVVPGREG